jgi:hypothetical protein
LPNPSASSQHRHAAILACGKFPFERFVF